MDAVWTHGARAAAHVRVDGVARELEVGEHVARADERRLPRLGHAHDLDHPRLRALHLGRLHLKGGVSMQAMFPVMYMKFNILILARAVHICKVVMDAYAL